MLKLSIYITASFLDVFMNIAKRFALEEIISSATVKVPKAFLYSFPVSITAKLNTVEILLPLLNSVLSFDLLSTIASDTLYESPASTGIVL